MDAEQLLPHTGPMCCIDRLLASSKTEALADVLLRPEHSLVCDGLLDPSGYVELAAQSAGAMQGFDQYRQGRPPKFGYLVGVQDFCVHGEARLGDRLEIAVGIEAELAGVTVLTVGIRRDGALLAEGRIKVYVPE
ncbi:MAG: hypothetical protein LBH65_06290 [Desulfovibrio sp.]|jgi:predicted hotdog family 3-hydroxylacyl-ACP dehydratase|nr:hypothetical protein [Desulfovibrio sp.]